MEAINVVEKKYLKEKLSEFRPGDTVRVHTRIKEGEKERIQIFEGVVIKRNRGGSNASFTVRKMSYGVGVERIFPTHSPFVENVEVVKKGVVRRSRLYYLRELSGRAARIKERSWAETLEKQVKQELAAGGTVDEQTIEEVQDSPDTNKKKTKKEK